MKRIDTFSLLLLSLSVLIFLSGFYYHQQVYRHDYRYAEVVSSVTSALSDSARTDGAVMSAPRGVITEEMGILVALCVAVALAVGAVVLSVVSRSKHGKSPFHLPVIFGGLSVAFWVAYMANSMGLLANA